MEAGETPLQCATRELHEETSIASAWPVTKKFYAHAVFPQMPGPHGTPPGFIAYEEHPVKTGIHMNFCFVAFIPKPVEIRPLEGEAIEYLEFDWFKYAHRRWIGRHTGKIASPLPPNVKDVLEYVRDMFDE